MNTPQFAATPELARAQCTAAYTDRTGATAGLVELLAATTNGTKVTQIAIKSVGNSSASNVLIFITDTAGASPRLFDEIALAAATPSNTIQSARNVVIYDDLQLKAGQKIMVGCTVTTTAVNVLASKGDF
jgi:hypothetical protein